MSFKDTKGSAMPLDTQSRIGLQINCKRRSSRSMG